MKRNRKIDITKIMCTLILACCVLLILIPLIKILICSVSDLRLEGLEFNPGLLIFDKYFDLFKGKYWVKILSNSLFVTLIGSFLGTFLSVCGGYALAQKSLPGREFFSAFILTTFVFEAGMVPTFLVVKELNLINTLWSVVFTGIVNVLYIFYLKSVFENVPREMIDSARLNGASDLNVFLKVVFPFCKPAVGIVFLMYVVKFWNDYSSYRIYITKNTMYNWQTYFHQFEYNLYQAWYTDWPYDKSNLCAMIMVCLIPSIIFLIFFNICLNCALEFGKEKEYNL